MGNSKTKVQKPKVDLNSFSPEEKDKISKNAGNSTKEYSTNKSLERDSGKLKNNSQ